jgi:hypothetical protein
MSKKSEIMNYMSFLLVIFLAFLAISTCSNVFSTFTFSFSCWIPLQPWKHLHFLAYNTCSEVRTWEQSCRSSFEFHENDYCLCFVSQTTSMWPHFNLVKVENQVTKAMLWNIHGEFGLFHCRTSALAEYIRWIWCLLKGSLSHHPYFNCSHQFVSL